MKICQKCGSADRYKSGACKLCQRENMRKYAAAHKPAINQYFASYYAENHSALLDYQARYRAENGEKIRQRDAAYAAANQGRIAAYKTAHYAENRAGVIARAAAYKAADKERARRHSRDCSARRRARQRAAECDPSVTLRDVIVLWGDDCYICGVKCDPAAAPGSRFKAELEHVVSLSRGGAHTLENLRCACGPCNRTKGAKRTAEDVRAMFT